MTVMTQTLKTFRENVLPRPTLFDILAHFEPQAHYQFSRRVRNDFEELANKYYKSTWMLGSYGGKAQMQTDIRGIGVASRIEIGRLVLREGNFQALIESAFELFQQAQEHQLASGNIDRLLVRFNKSDERPRDRQHLGAVFAKVFGEQCTFMNHNENLLEMGHSVVYQTIVQYLREDGLYHSAHRNRIETVQRHLQQEVGRYENFKFYVRPTAVEGNIPRLDFCYTGDAPDKMVEAFMAGYTEEHPEFVAPDAFRAQRPRFVGLNAYERASRRYGGLWILQHDIVRFITSQQVSVLYLFFNQDFQPEEESWLSWDDLFLRQQISPFINRSSRNSQTFLEMILEALVRNGFIEEDGDVFRLARGFSNFKHVSFYQLGDYRRQGI